MKKKTTKKVVTKKELKTLKIDLGCGPNPREGFVGVDMFKMKGVDIVCDLAKDKWPFKDNSVDEAHASHFIEHLTNLNGKWERTHFFNELHRVLVKGEYDGAGKPIKGFATLIFPHWCSNRYYGDPTHKEPFSEMGFCYLTQEWRMSQAPHADAKWQKGGYTCDFDWSYGYSLRQDIVIRNQEYQQNAMQNFKEVCQDIIATITKR
jgi:Methyltransferase domain